VSAPSAAATLPTREPGAAPSAPAVLSSAARDAFEREATPALPALARRALRLARDPEAADDLVQDTLEHALRGYAGYVPGTNMRAWLLTIMHNLHVTTARRRARRPLAVSIEGLRDAHGWEPDARVADVATIVADDDGEATLLRRIAALPAEFRTVVELADVHGICHQRISRVLGVPGGTVASRLFRGRRRLQAAIRAERDADERGVAGPTATNAPRRMTQRSPARAAVAR
jgi:RNA polymerase sigma-70 factor, ECF subfamily